MNIVLLIFLHLAALVGGLIFIRLKAPAGALVGSMAFVVLFLFITKVEINYYFTLRFLAQSLSGLIIGLGFSKSNLTTLKRMAKPTLALIVTIIVVNIGFSFIMEATTKLNYMTSLFATGLGGVADLALIATDFNADLEPVALLQLFRLVTVVVVFPPLVKISLKHKKIISHEDLPTVVKKGKVENYFITLAVALLGSAIFHITRVPAGAILGSIFATALLNIMTTKGGAPASLKPLAQMLVGSYIGSNLTIDTIMKLNELFIPYLILVAEIFTIALIGAIVLVLFYKFDWPTAFFCSAPGGVHVMGLIGQEMGIDGPTVVLMHTMRIFGTLMVLPIYANFIV